MHLPKLYLQTSKSQTLLRIAHPAAPVNIHLQASLRVYEYCYSATQLVHVAPLPSSVRGYCQSEHAYCSTTDIAKVPMDTPARSFTRHCQVLLVVCCSRIFRCAERCAPSQMHCVLYTACTGRYIVSCAEFHRRSFSYHSVKVVYRIVHSSARIDHSTGNAI